MSERVLVTLEVPDGAQPLLGSQAEVVVSLLQRSVGDRARVLSVVAALDSHARDAEVEQARVRLRKLRVRVALMHGESIAGRKPSTENLDEWLAALDELISRLNAIFARI